MKKASKVESVNRMAKAIEAAEESINGCDYQHEMHEVLESLEELGADSGTVENATLAFSRIANELAQSITREGELEDRISNMESPDFLVDVLRLIHSLDGVEIPGYYAQYLDLRKLRDDTEHFLKASNELASATA